MTPADLADAIVAAIGRAVADGDLDVTVPTTVTVERPKNPEHGDYASPVALQLAKAARRPPRAVARRWPPGWVRTTRSRGSTSLDRAS